MKVVILSKALQSVAYRRKTDAIAATPGIDLTVVVPPTWDEPRAAQVRYENGPTPGYRVIQTPIWHNGHHHTHWYPKFGAIVRAIRPDVVHVDEEAFNFATYTALRAAHAVGAKTCFYNYANIERRYPPPFGWFEQYAYRTVAHAVACSHEAAAIIRGHGYSGPLSILPQTGVDPEHYSPVPSDSARDGFTLGYVGRFVPEKGIGDLVAALALLEPRYRLVRVGAGSDEARLRALADTLGVAGRITWHAPVPTTEVPAVMRAFDALVLPSRTTSNWKEQFGRVIIEAMACGVPVIGSSSGEIPHVVGDGGIVYLEGDTTALAAAVRRLGGDPQLQAAYAQAARARVLAHYTQTAVAAQYVSLYRSMLESVHGAK
jgi:glycosyltransferase involved in cell wall biosynthesis